MLEINMLVEKIKELKARFEFFRGIFDLNTKKNRLLEIQQELENPNIWQNFEEARSLSCERSELEELVRNFDIISQRIIDIIEIVNLAKEEKGIDLIADLNNDFKKLNETVSNMVFQGMFSGAMDHNNAYLDIQAGSGGIEAQDWAEILLRMYLRWGDKHGFKTVLMEASAGEVAGIKSATIEFQGSFAYGWLRSEIGVHRLVRKSPFDSGNRRHTSFSSVFVSPEINNDITIAAINPTELRIDTYRARGAGGQHVNRTDSAVRITHLSTGVIVQCQSNRSQHKNKTQAMKQLRAKLYEIEMMKKREEKALLEASKSEISWGNHIRSYVLDASRIKDIRTGIETSNVQTVLDGDIDLFIEAYLKQKSLSKMILK